MTSRAEPTVVAPPGPARPEGPAAGTAPRSASGWLGSIDPRYLQVGLATSILVVGQLLFQTIGGFDRLAVGLLCAVAADAVLSRATRGIWPNVASAIISGLSVVILVKPTYGLWPFALGSLLSIGSKYAITWRRRHLCNPTNFGICALLLTAPDHVAILSTQWGNSLGALAFVWAWGLLVARRARVLHVTLSYLVAFAALAALRSQQTGNGYLSEIAPLTGPMHTLFIFFMITDPATIVSRRAARIAVVVGVAVVEHLFRMQNEWRLPGLDFVLWAPPMFALFFVGPAARWIDLQWVAGAATFRPGARR